jgi:5-formyltetrahydrofolate cyclo-ligase
VVRDRAEAKHRIRSTLTTRLKLTPRREAAAAAAAILEAILEEPRVRAASRIALYAALPDEIPTRGIFEGLRCLAAERLLPRIEGDAIVWARVDDWAALEPGRFGILEPSAASPSELKPNDVALVPGVAFDREGSRLGRGGGYYDRAFPPGAPSPWLVGIGYTFQWLSSVPHDSRDRRVDAVVTECGWVWRARGAR